MNFESVFKVLKTLKLSQSGLQLDHLTSFMKGVHIQRNGNIVLMLCR